MLASHFLWKQFYNNGDHLLKLADFFKKFQPLLIITLRNLASWIL